MRHFLMFAFASLALATAANAATTINLGASGNNNGMTFFGGAAPNVSPADPTGIYVQINSNAQGAQIPGGFAPGNQPQFNGANWTLDWVLGGFPAPSPAGNINAAFKLVENGSTASNYVFNVLAAPTPAVITLTFTSGAYNGLAGTLNFYQFLQAKNPPQGQNNLLITAFANFTPTTDPFGFGPGLLTLTFNDTNNKVVDVRGNAKVISQQTFTGTLTSAPVPEPATWAMMLLGFGGIGMTMRRRRKNRAGADRLRTTDGRCSR